MVRTDTDGFERFVLDAQAAAADPSARQEAFGELVKRFQDMAYGCAYAVLGDVHLAQDAAQEAFIVAYRHLDQLQVPRAFPGWLKRITLSQCYHLTRAKQLSTLPFDAAVDVPSSQPGPS